MTKFFTLIFLFLNFFTSVFPQKLDAYFNYATFYNPQDKPYLEVYVSLVGNSLTQLKNKNSKLQGEVEVTMLVKEKDKIIDFKKQNYLSPEAVDSTKGFQNFLVLQRFSLPNGAYNFEIEILDKNNFKDTLKYTQPIEINYSESSVAISDIELIEHYSVTKEQNILSKSGYDLIPNISNFYPKSVNKFVFYCEIYNTEKLLGKGEQFVVDYFLEHSEDNRRLATYGGFTKENCAPANVVFNQITITDLTTGNYNLVMQVRSKTNQLITQKKLFFQRSNTVAEVTTLDNLETVNIENSFVSRSPFTNIDSINDLINSLRPISSRLEQIFAENQMKEKDIKMKQKFFLNFWQKRNYNNPEKAWNDYYKNVRKVNKEYGTSIRKGYETDRGRVYLQYGEPSTIVKRSTDPAAYPYEIWHYYHIKNFNNRKFLFYNPDVVTNDFVLLHSDLFGETYNRRWQIVLYQRMSSTDPYKKSYNIDDEKINQNYGNEAETLWNSPK